MSGEETNSALRPTHNFEFNLTGNFEIGLASDTKLNLHLSRKPVRLAVQLAILNCAKGKLILTPLWNWD